MTTKQKNRSSLPVELPTAASTSAPFVNPEFVDPFPPGIYNSQRHTIILGEKIGGGGEGNVYHIEGHTDLVAKIYHEPPAAEKAEKLIALASISHERLFKMAAWPVDVLRDRPDGNVIGFVMKKIGQAAEVHTLHSPKSRLKKFPEASWGFLLHVATNIVRAVATMHEHGFVIGDVNPKNILVTRQATVFLLDCDSFQFAADGKTYRCEGGFPEYTPPELQGIPFAEIDRTPEHDCFGLAVVIFQLLFLGRHPFSGRFLGAGEMPLEQAIRELRFAYGDDAVTREMQPPPGTLPLAAIPAELMALFRRAFLESDRPNPSEWLSPLAQLGQALQVCNLHNGHQYFTELTACPWCELESRVNIRLFNLKLGTRSQSQFILEDLWAEVEDLGQLNLLPKRLNLPASKPSPTARNFALVRDLRYRLAIGFSVLTGGLIGWFSDFPTAFWFLVFAGFAARFLAIVNDGEEIKWEGFFPPGLRVPDVALVAKTQRAKKKAEKRLQQLEVQFWNKKDGEREFIDRFNDLQKQLHEYEVLDQQRALKYKRASAKARAAALKKYLQTFSIQEAGIVSASLTNWLHAKGVVSAAEITEQRIKDMGAVKESQLQRLLKWRRELEAQFNFNPSVQVAPQARMQIEAELDTQRQQLESDLLTKTRQLQVVKQQLKARHDQLLPFWIETHQAVAQAETDLEEVTKVNRLSPVIAALVVPFLVISFFEFLYTPHFPPLSSRQETSGTVNLPKGNTAPSIISSPECRRYFEDGERHFQVREYRAAKEAYQQAITAMSRSPWEQGFTQVIYKYGLSVEMLNEVAQEIALLEEQVDSTLKDEDRAKLMIFYWMKSKDELARIQYSALKQSYPAMAEGVRQFIAGFGVNLGRPLTD